MSHFTVLVRFEGDIAKAEERIAELLAPYDENLEVAPYKHYMSKESVEGALKHYGKKGLLSPSGVPLPDSELTAEEIKDWDGGDGGKDKKGYFYYTKFNKRAKWDWYSIGGRWQGMFLTKDGALGRFRRQPNLHKEGIPILEQLKEEKGTGSGRVDIAYLKDT